MTFDYISDLHINFIFGEKEPNERKIKLWFDKVFENKSSNTLLVPGDISESIPHTFTFFKLIQEIYGYKNIVFTFGNHDYWIISGKQKSKYKTSPNKIEIAKNLSKKYNRENNNKIYLLDGDCIEIEGVKIGGAMGWYDTSYFYKTRGMYSIQDPYAFWKTYSNDQRYIVPMKNDFQRITKVELNKVNNAIIQKPDIMMTHICPIISDRVVFEQYKSNLGNTFYMFNGEELIYEYSPKYWIYGHMHGQHKLQVGNTILVRNAHGYPSEKLKQEIRTIIIS
jgi:predicted phosphohydrolase